VTHDASETWPSQWIVDSWQGDFGIQFRPGEDTTVHDPEAARRFRDTLGRFATGVTVVTALSDGTPVGLTCQSFSSVSLDPPLVLFCPARTSRAWPLIERAGTFCVNLLARDQVELSDAMASRGVDKFEGVGWSPAPVTGAPLLDGVLGHVECEVHAVHDGGDHHVVLGRVVGLATTDVTEPLLFAEGRYAGLDRD
jgi:3-hydroxy-9,10-secoandrosta-1,3,5(10)-triene-9,17-dione monooxygenase reductase component